MAVSRYPNFSQDFMPDTVQNRADGTKRFYRNGSILLDGWGKEIISVEDLTKNLLHGTILVKDPNSSTLYNPRFVKEISPKLVYNEICGLLNYIKSRRELSYGNN